ncbi:hypothetical protein SCUP515_13304 [Seiridium cupressi]
MIPDRRGAGQDASQDHHHISDLEDAAGENLDNSRNRLEGSAGTSSSLLENLPAELRTLLLSSMPDLPTLRSIVHASPVLHAQYRYDRNSILRACLDRELDGFFTDAYATVKSRIRAYRALYRYDTYHHLFGQNHGRRHGSFRHHEIHELFFTLFDPWEAEAIGCIDIFVRHKYEDIFNQIKKDLDPENDRFRQENGVYNPEGSYDLVIEHDGK